MSGLPDFMVLSFRRSDAMPVNRVQLVITLQPDDDAQAPCPVLLDANAVDDFLKWLQVNPEFERRLREEKAYSIRAILNHLNQRPDWKRKEKGFEVGIKERLERHGVQLVTFNAGRSEVMVGELQMAYFGNDATAHKSAQLLTYGRQQRHDGRAVRIISRHSGFRSVPNIDLYVFDINDPGIASDAILLQEFAALNLHRTVREASYEYVRNRDYPTAILQVVNELYTHMRTISGLTTDGRQLIDVAIGSNTPIIQLNTLASDTERKEQRGYVEFGYGVTDALRNVLSHHLADRPILEARFGDRHTAFKFLSLLSLLFEKIDNRVAPR